MKFKQKYYKPVQKNGKITNSPYVLSKRFKLYQLDTGFKVQYGLLLSHTNESIQRKNQNCLQKEKYLYEKEIP